MTKRAIQAQSLCLSFQNELALRDVNFSIPRSGFVSLLGPSGCGKTSILRIVAGLQRPSSGRLDLMSSDGESSPRIGYVFQDPTLLPWRNVLENVQLPLELDGENTAAATSAAHRVLEMVGLRTTDYTKFPRMLSGGMRMRVSLARALIIRPEILLLDEPFAALDDLLRQRLNEDLLQLWLSEHWTAMFVTHNVAEAVYLSQEIFVISDRPGTIVTRILVPFHYPRNPALRSDAEFASLTGHLSGLLRGRAMS